MNTPCIISPDPQYNHWWCQWVNNVDLKMELDTGTSVSIISEATYNHHWPQGQAPALRESHVKLKTYSGEQVAVKGVVDVTVQYNDQTEQLQLMVARGN